MNHEYITPFIHLLDTDPDTKAKFKALNMNDWGGLAALAADAGFEITAEDLMSILPSRFYRNYGQRPDKGWNMPEEKAQQLKKKESK